MKISTLGYTIKEGFKNVWTNKVFSIASVATMAACIFLFGVFYSLLVNFQNIIQNVESEVAITVFFDEGTSQERIDQIGQLIASREEVYKLIYFEGDEEAAESFGTDNPLANDATYEIYMTDISYQQELVDYLSSVDNVREVRQSEDVANTLSDANRVLGIVSAAIIIILICVAVFLISNTVRTGITVRKEEIGIMKMIGATDFLVRAPFIVEGILIGAVGAIIPLAILYAVYGRVIKYVLERFEFLSNMMDFVPVRDVFIVLLPVGLILGIGIGYVGSRITVHKHINV